MKFQTTMKSDEVKAESRVRDPGPFMTVDPGAFMTTNEVERVTKLFGLADEGFAKMVECYRLTLRRSAVKMSLLRPKYPFEWWKSPRVDVLSAEDGLNDEEILLLYRFFLARNGKTEAAIEMLSNFLKWREERDMENNEKDYSYIFKILQEHYPFGYYGVAKDGSPVYYDRLGQLNVEGLINQLSIDEVERIWARTYERAQQLVLPAASLASGHRIYQGITILDLAGLGWSQFNSETRSLLKRLVNISQDNYPESMRLLLIINAPMVVNAVLPFVRALIDKKTADKIVLLNERGLPLRRRLTEYIDEDQLPSFLFDSKDENEWLVRPIGPWEDPRIAGQINFIFSLEPDFYDARSQESSSVHESEISRDECFSVDCSREWWWWLPWAFSRGGC